MIYTKIDAIGTLKPDAEWTWVGKDYSGLNWLDSTTKPTESEIGAAIITPFPPLCVSLI